MERLLTLQEVALQLRVSESSVLRRVHAGDIPAIRVGRLWRFDPEDVREYLDRTREAASQQL